MRKRRTEFAVWNTAIETGLCVYTEIRAGKRVRSQNMERATNNTLPLVYELVTFVALGIVCMYVIRHYGVDQDV